MSHIFISYRRMDSEGYAGRIWDRLAARFGSEVVFMDVDSIQAGESFFEVLSNALSTCDAVVAIVGREWLGAQHDGRRRIDNDEDFVRQEIHAALNRGITTIPVLVSGAKMPTSSELPVALTAFSKLQAVEIRHSRFDADVLALIKDIEIALEDAKQRRLVKGPDAPSASPTAETKAVLRRVLGSPRGFAELLFDDSRLI